MSKYEDEIKDVLGDDDCLIISKSKGADTDFIAISTKNRLLGSFSVVHAGGTQRRLGNYKILKLAGPREQITHFVIRNGSIEIGTEKFKFDNSSFTHNEIKMVLAKLDELNELCTHEPINLLVVD